MATEIKITGNTYAAREYLKDAGGRWDAASKSWTMAQEAWDDLKAKATPTYSRSLYKALKGLTVDGAGSVPVAVSSIRPALCRRCGSYCYGDCTAAVVGGR